jgi:hydroxyacylglutathione hydrolase
LCNKCHTVQQNTILFLHHKLITMTIEQIYTGCLSQGAYYITSNGEAVIIDPLRETKPYLERLERDNVTLKYIFETHFHADFVSGHLDLSKETGASIVYGPNAVTEFDFVLAKDNQEFKVGKITIKALHTPGHTMESTTYLLINENGKQHAIFSGDTLFIGDVGRPDLAQKSASMTQDELATKLFHSLRTKIMTLPNDVIVYPAHGAGSACGKNMSKETVSTIGEQKATNYALRANMTEAEFVKEVTDGLLPPPAYFGMNVAMNKKGYASFETVFNNGMKPIKASDFEAIAEAAAALILDTRDSGDFSKGYIPQSISIGISGDFAPWVGSLIADVAQPIILVTELGKEEETVTRLSRVGFDNLMGYLQGGFEAWKNEGFQVDTVDRINADQLVNELKIYKSKVLDIRRESEYVAEHVEEAYCRPLSDVNNWIKTIDANEHFYMHCASGYRSMIAASILQARGYRNFTEIEGGYNAMKITSIPKTDFICQSKL